MGDYLTAQEIASRLEVTVDTVRRWLRTGKLKGRLLGRAGYRIEEKDFFLFMQMQQNTSPPSLSSQPQYPQPAETLSQLHSLPVPINYEQILALSKNAIIMRDSMSAIISWNEGATTLYGWSAQDVQGKFTHTLLQTHFPTTREDVDLHLIQHGYWRGELQHIGRDGRQITVESHQQLIRNDQGHPALILEINYDITHHKQTEAILQFLADVSHVVHFTSDDETIILKKIIKLAVSTIADICFFDLLLPDNTLQRIADEQNQLMLNVSLPQFLTIIPAPHATSHPVRRAIHTAQPIIISSDHIPALTGTGNVNTDADSTQSQHTISVISVPLQAQNCILGALTLCYTATATDRSPLQNLNLAQELANRVAMAITSSRLYREQAQARLHAEELARELEKQRAYLETTHYAASIGTFEWDIINDTIYWTPGLRALYGLSDTVETSTYTAWKQRIHPEDHSKIERHLQTVLEEGIPYDVTFRIVLPDTSIRWLLGKGKVLFDKQHRPCAMIGSNVDITERKQAEESHLQFVALIENSTDFIGIASLDGMVSYLNQAGCTLIGIDNAHDLQARHIKSYLPEQLHEYYTEVIEPQVKFRGYWEGDIQFQNAQTGESIAMRQTVFMVVDPQTGSPMCIATIAHDIRAQKAFEQRKDAFVSMASHELRNPLTTIQANLQLAERRIRNILPQPEIQALSENRYKAIHDAQLMLERALRQTKVMNRLISDLLDGTRIQANKLNLSLSEHDIVSIVKDVTEDQREVSTQRTIRLEIPEAHPIIVLADRDRIGQVVGNYLTNALKYSPPNEEVVVGVAHNEQQVRVWVSDCGPGLAPEQQEHIWDRYYQAQGITIQSGTGVDLGLGLHICKTLITRHGGEVGVDSIPGNGSTFWFTLPLAETLGYN